MSDDRDGCGAGTGSLLIRIPEAALLLSVGRSTVYELIAEGHLETVHIGRAVRVTTASVEDFVNRHRSPRPQTEAARTNRR